MSWFAAGLALPLLLIGSPVGAEEFSVVVMRGSTVVRVTGSEDGERREETLREDPTPDLPPSETEASARPASDDSRPTVQVIVEQAETPSSVGYIVVQPRARHHGRAHVGPSRHGRSHRGRGFEHPGGARTFSPVNWRLRGPARP